MSTERQEKDKKGRVFYIAKNMADKRTPLTRQHFDQACSDFLQEKSDERSTFGRAVGRVLSRAALMTSMARSKVPTSTEFKMLFNTQTHHNLEDCLASLARRLPLSCEAFTLSLYYIDLLQSAHDGLVTWLNIERLFAVGIVLASKFAYDRVYTNNYYARVLGVDVSMLNRMEVAMLRLLDFNLTPNPERWTQLHAFVASVAFETPLPVQPNNGFASPAAPAPTKPTALSSLGLPSSPAPVPVTIVQTPRLKRFGETDSSSISTALSHPPETKPESSADPVPEQAAAPAPAPAAEEVAPTQPPEMKREEQETQP